MRGIELSTGEWYTLRQITWEDILVLNVYPPGPIAITACAFVAGSIDEKYLEGKDLQRPGEDAIAILNATAKWHAEDISGKHQSSRNAEACWKHLSTATQVKRRDILD